MDDLAGRVAVVTGAASGIGLGLARAFVGEGMRVVLADVDSEGARGAARTLVDGGAEALGVEVDVSDSEAVSHLADEAFGRFGRVDVVCNNAGVIALGPTWEISEPAWRWVIGVNLVGVVNGIRAFVPRLVEAGEGHVINTASMAGLLATGFTGPYTATKHAVVGLSECLYHELSGTGVGVSVLCPGFVRSRLMEADRNWPAGLGEAPPRPSDAGGSATEAFFAQGIEGGGDPLAKVGRAAIDAILEQRFWVLTDPDLAALVTGRFAAAVEGRAPRY